jgi:hypothetical protein
MIPSGLEYAEETNFEIAQEFPAAVADCRAIG